MIAFCSFNDLIHKASAAVKGTRHFSCVSFLLEKCKTHIYYENMLSLTGQTRINNDQLELRKDFFAVSSMLFPNLNPTDAFLEHKRWTFPQQTINWSRFKHTNKGFNCETANVDRLVAKMWLEERLWLCCFLIDDNAEKNICTFMFNNKIPVK